MDCGHFFFSWIYSEAKLLIAVQQFFLVSIGGNSGDMKLILK